MSYFYEKLVPYTKRLGLVGSIASTPASYAGYLGSNTGPSLAIVTFSLKLFLSSLLQRLLCFSTTNLKTFRFIVKVSVLICEDLDPSPTELCHKCP